MGDVTRSSGLLAVGLASDVECCDEAESRPRRFDLPLPALAALLAWLSAPLNSSRLPSRTPCSSSRRVSSTPNPTSRSGRRSATSCGNTDASSTRRIAVVSTAMRRWASSVVSFLRAGCKPRRASPRALPPQPAATPAFVVASDWTSGLNSLPPDVVDVVDFLSRCGVDSIVSTGIASVKLAAMTPLQRLWRRRNLGNLDEGYVSSYTVFLGDKVPPHSMLADVFTSDNHAQTPSEESSRTHYSHLFTLPTPIPTCVSHSAYIHVHWCNSLIWSLCVDWSDSL